MTLISVRRHGDSIMMIGRRDNDTLLTASCNIATFEEIVHDTARPNEVDFDIWGAMERLFTQLCKEEEMQ